MVDFERILAGVVVGICVLLLVRLSIGARRRQRLDRVLLDRWQALRRVAWSVWHWRASRRAATQAADEARRAIERARQRKVDRQGNVYTPEAFKEPRKPH